MTDRVERSSEVVLEHALGEVDRLFGELTSSVEEIIAITTADGQRNVYLSPAFEWITGTPRERVLADAASFLELVHPDDRHVLYEAHENRHRPHEYGYRIVRPDGETRWLQARAFPVRDDSGEVVRIATIVRDATREREAEERAEGQRRLLAGVTGALTALLTSDDSEATIREALRELAVAVGVDRVYVAAHEHHRDSGDTVLRLTHEWTRDGVDLVFGVEGRSTVRVPPAQHPLIAGVEAGRVLALKRSELPADAQIAVAGGMQSLLIVPVIDSRGCWGHVGLVDASEEHDWPEDTRRILETAAAAIGTVIARQRSIRDLENQVERMSALYAAIANPTLPVSEQIHKALATVSQLLDMEEASLVRLPATADAEVSRVAWAHPRDSGHPPGTEVPFDAEVFERSVQDGEPTSIADFVGTPLEGHPVHREGFRSFIGFPVWVRGRLWGGLALLSPRPRSRPFGRTDADLLRVVARGIGLMLEQHEAEERQRRYEDQFRETQRLESLGVLAGGIAHDFNNLLMGVMGNASLAMMEANGSTRLSESLEQIVAAARRASDLTRQMLAYAGKSSFRVEPLDLRALISEMGELLVTVLPPDARIEYQLDEDLPPVLGDSSQVQQVVMNLITNAADALEGRSGRVRVCAGLEDAGSEPPAGRFVSDGAPPGPYVYLEVEDDGAGMSEQTVERIFEPFFTTKFTGRGLGLAAVLGIVRSHRGALRVHSSPGAGTTFRVLFPAATEEAPARRTEDPAPRSLAQRVLVVDDVPQVRDTIRRILEYHGVQVLEATDGEHAVRLVREQAGGLDAVVLDLTMPRLDGVEAHRSIRELRPGLPIIVMSGYAEDGAVAVLSRQPRTAFLQKPFRSADLVARLAEVVGR